MDIRIIGAAVAAIGMLNSCANPIIRPNRSRAASVLFSGFTYVGCFSGGLKTAIPSHGTQGLPLPEEFRPGLQYVFHFPSSDGTSPSPLEILPKRLRDMGFVAPDPTNIVDFSSGGPSYEIEFSGPRCAGKIRHDVDGRLLNSRLPWNRKWEPDDTILSVSVGCAL